MGLGCSGGLAGVGTACAASSASRLRGLSACMRGSETNADYSSQVFLRMCRLSGLPELLAAWLLEFVERSFARLLDGQELKLAEKLLFSVVSSLPWVAFLLKIKF